MRKAALWQLSNAFVHQDTVWTAAVAAIPFLAELLSAPEVGSKDGILMLLGDIANGYYSSYVAVGAREGETSGNEPNEDAATLTMHGWNQDDDEVDGDESENGIGGAHEPQISSIRKGILVYLSLLDDDDPAVRVAAVYLLAQCDSPAFAARPMLEAVYQHEEDPGVRASLMLACGGLRHQPEERRAFFHEALTNPLLSLVERVAAAEMLLDQSKDPVPDAAIALLGNALAYP